MENIKNNNITNELELTDEQAARMDELDNAAHEYLKVLTNNPDLDWDQNYIGDLNDLAADLMYRKGFKVYYPAIETDPDGTQRRIDFYEPDSVIYDHIIDGAYWSDEFELCKNGKIPEWFKKYDINGIMIWARDEEEAMIIAGDFTKEEVDAYAAYIEAQQSAQNVRN